MARARNIKPGFFTNDDLVELPFEYRLLFIGLWTIADREGRLVDRPKKIKMEIFPGDSVDCEAGLAALAAAGFIARYEVEGNRYIQVSNWAKHQNPHVKEAHSLIPAPCEPGASTIQAPGKAQPLPERAGLIADSGFLIPDSKDPPNPPSQGGEEPDEPSAGKPKRERKERLSLKTFLERCRTAGETAISGYKPLLEYVDGSGLPMEFVQLAWDVFKAEHSAGGVNERRLQADWRRHFLNYVTKGYYRLWYADAQGQYSLTTVGIQAQKIHAKRDAA